MATRGAIVRPKKDGFEGRYHHWDSYPSGLGRALFRFVKEVGPEKAAKFLIDDHPAGWSTIVGRDMAVEPGFTEPYSDDYLCKLCKEPIWKHYVSGYTQRNLPLPPKNKNPQGSGNLLTDHLPEPIYPDSLHLAPQCYCHGDRSEQEHTVNESNAAGMGCEYVYVLDGTKIHVLSSYVGVRKMIGLFGVGDHDAEWHFVVTVDTKGDEPNWKRIDDFAREEKPQSS